MKNLKSFRFWWVRSLMFLWGFIVTFYFTGNVITSFKVFLAQAIGNTIIMLLI